VDQQFESPHPNGAVTVTEPPRRRRIPRPVLITVLVVVGAAWAYAIWYSVNRTSPEDLDDASNAAIGDACTGALSELRALPPLGEDASAAEGVALAEQENEIFTAMIEQFAAIRPDAGDDAVDAYRAWIDDWRALLSARAQFADDLAADGSARLETPSISSGSVRPITDRMNEYASQRVLVNCEPDVLQAEVVDGPRAYPDET
jgi:hypothetical protein